MLIGKFVTIVSIYFIPTCYICNIQASNDKFNFNKSGKNLNTAIIKILSNQKLLNKDEKEKSSNIIKKILSSIDKEFFKIIGLSVLVAVTYGIIHDQITARMSPKYFTSWAVPHHKEVSNALGLSPGTSPTIVGLVYGIIATWFVGAILGTTAASCARVGDKLPKLVAKDLIKPMLAHLIFTGVCAFLAGNCAVATEEELKHEFHEGLNYKSHNELPYIVYYTPMTLQELKDFKRVSYAHSTSYLTGVLNEIVLMAWIIKKRIKLAKEKEEQEKESLDLENPIPSTS